MKSRVLLVSGAASLALAGALLLGSFGGREVPAKRIAGGVQAIPIAAPAAEFLLPAALDAAHQEAMRQGARALVVHRRGHRVFAYFAPEQDGTQQLDGGELAAAVLALTLHEPAQAASIAAAEAATLVSERLWLPLGAGDAMLSDAQEQGRRRCCIRARLDDWMRVGDLLLGLGAYRGERIIATDPVRQWLAARAAPAWQGDEPPLAHDALAVDLQPGTRLWLVPRRQLAILVQGDAAVARDTLIPNIILRGLDDPAPAIGAGIGDIVPGH